MISLSAIITLLVVYFIALFFVAIYVERQYKRGTNLTNNALVYVLSLAIYATAWTFYGNVGLATSSSYAFLGIYTGPTLAMLFAWPIIRKLVRIRDEYGIASISGLLSSRYNRSYGVGVIATLVALIGVTPYFSLQFKAIFSSFSFIVSGGTQYDSAIIRLTTVGMIILFTIVFGFRKLEQTERHPGMVIVVAIQSVIKLAAFLAAGVFATYYLFNGFGDIFAQIKQHASLSAAVSAGAPSYSLFISYIIVGIFAFFLLPRDFHLAVTENSDERHIRASAWGVPVYMMLITLFVFPIAMAGILKGYDINLADTFILLVSALSGHAWLTVLVFIGGISAAFSMIMVETVAITTMVANNLALPLVDRVQLFGFLRKHLLPLRWGIAVLILLMGYGFELLTGSSYVLVKIGIISFAAVLQFAPAVIGGLYWEKGNTAGAAMGLIGGSAVWAYTSLTPALIRSGWMPYSLLTDGPFGIRALRPEHLFGITGIDPLASTIIFTLLINGGLYIVGSLAFKQSEDEQRFAYNFVHIMRGARFLPRDVSQKEYINVDKKRVAVNAIFAHYLNAVEAKQQTEECMQKAGLASKQLMSVNALIELSNIVENALAGYVGAPAARDALSAEHLFAPDEAAQIAGIYATIADELKITPEQFIEQLSQQRMLAQSKSNFMAIASHEMRTPLTIIRGNAELLLQFIKPTEENKDTIKFLEGIKQNSVRLLDILHDFIDVMHYEESKTELKKEPFDLAMLVRDVISDMQSVASEKHLSLQYATSTAATTMAIGDQTKMREVIVNLVANAIHYTEQGGITITAGNIDVSGRRFVTIFVSDTGVGILPENQSLLFQKFSTVQKTFLRTREYGSGLGLYISRLLMESMGGFIKLEQSVPGKGSTFSVSLPAV